MREAEELLVGADWRPVEVNGNGHHDALGPTVELVAANGHNGNGHHDEAAEPQRSLFSWAEFIAAEPARSRRRSLKPQPASMSMFEWALEQERERKAEAELGPVDVLINNATGWSPDT